jgi:hypothetical protein
MPESIKGLTTISWGTDGVLTDTALDTEVIVESLQVTPKVEVPEIEDNDGFTVAEVILNNGFDAAVKVVFDTAVTWPVIGDVVRVKLPHIASAYECLLVSITPEAMRKKEKMLTLNVQYRPGVDLTP